MKKIIYALFAIVTLFSGSSLVSAHMGDDSGWGWGMMNGMMGSGFGFFWMGWVTMILFWTILVLIVIALWKWINKK